LPGNCSFFQRNALEGLPFPDATFDYITQRRMTATWTKQQWTLMTAEMVRVLKPGGYIEFWEIDYEPLRQGPASRAINGALAYGMQARGMDPYVSRRLQGLLTAQGIKKINANFFSLPFAWGGPIGELNEHVLVSGVLSMKPWLTQTMNVDSEEFDMMAMDSIKQLQEKRSYVNYHQAWGMKSRSKPLEGYANNEGFAVGERRRKYVPGFAT